MTFAEYLAQLEAQSGRPLGARPDAIAVFFSGGRGAGFPRNEVLAENCATNPNFYTIYNTPVGQVALAAQRDLTITQKG